MDKLAANPNPKSASASASVSVKFELSGSNPAEQAQSIVLAASQGVLSPSVTCELLKSVASCMKIVEVSELISRIEALEQH